MFLTLNLIIKYCIFNDDLQNATIAEYGTYSYLTNPSDIVHKLQSEIYARGPVATGVNAEPIVEYSKFCDILSGNSFHCICKLGTLYSSSNQRHY